MDTRQNRIRTLGADQCSDDGGAHQTGAACTAFAWLVLYGMAVTGSLFWDAWQHKHETPIVAAAAQNPEHRQ